jgi:hypothetical protein
MESEKCLGYHKLMKEYRLKCLTDKMNNINEWKFSFPCLQSYYIERKHEKECVKNDT